MNKRLYQFSGYPQKKILKKERSLKYAWLHVDMKKKKHVSKGFSDLLQRKFTYDTYHHSISWLEDQLF